MSEPILELFKVIAEAANGGRDCTDGPSEEALRSRRLIPLHKWVDQLIKMGGPTLRMYLNCYHDHMKALVKINIVHKSKLLAFAILKYQQFSRLQVLKVLVISI